MDDNILRNPLNFNKSEFSAYNDSYFTQLINSHLGNSHDNDDFYNKLVELKNEQKKTLMFMQELYNQKQVLKEEIEKSEINLKELRSVSYPIKDDDYEYRIHTISAYEKNSNPNNNEHDYSVIENNKTNLFDEKLHFHSAKPPPIPTRNTVTFKNKLDIIENDYEPNSNKNHTSSSAIILESLDDDLRKIETMWNDFDPNIDRKSIEFNQRFVKRKVKKESNPKSRTRKSVQVEWVPRVTIPEPFSMTIRESIKQDERLKRAAREQQIEREKRIEEELRESKNKFKANPVPAHVNVPLYEKLKLEEELRKHKLKRMSKEYLDKVSKPFNLTEKKLNLKDRRHSISYDEEFSNTEKLRNEFNAQPLPDFYFNDEFIHEKMRENELFRQINKKMRALDLLNKSKMPHNMELQEAKKKLEIERNKIFIKEMNRLQRELNQKESRRTHDVPDFEELYRKFVIQLETKKSINRKNIRPEPFVLRAAARSRKHCVEDGNLHDAKHNMRSSSSLSRLNRSVSISMDSLPIKGTDAQRLRESTNKEKMNEIIKKELEQEHIEKIKKLRAKKIHEQIQEKVNYDPVEIDKQIERQTRKLKLEQKQQEDEYEQKMAEMGKKIENRRLQIEQVDQENRRKALEKKYNEALKMAGITEHDLKDLNNNPITHIAKSVSYEATDDWVNE